MNEPWLESESEIQTKRSSSMKTPTNSSAWLFRKMWPGEPVSHATHRSDSELIETIINRELAKSEAQYIQNLMGPLHWQTVEEPILLEKSRQAGRPEAMPVTAWMGKTGIN